MIEVLCIICTETGRPERFPSAWKHFGRALLCLTADLSTRPGTRASGATSGGRFIWTFARGWGGDGGVAMNGRPMALQRPPAGPAMPSFHFADHFKHDLNRNA